MKGRLFGVGVGPGDPELMTYKAVRIIKECQVLAVPARGRKHAVSYRIAAEMIENMEEISDIRKNFYKKIICKEDFPPHLYNL